MKDEKLFEIKDYVMMADYLSGHFGNIENILVNNQEDFPIDIVVFGPNEKSPYWKLVTIGASDYAMKVPNEIKELNRIEIVMYLPIDWKLEENELNFWPIKTLLETARYPHENDTYLGIGHTLEFEESFPKQCEFQSIGLVEALDEDFNTFHCSMNNKNIHFLQAFPMSSDEIRFKKKYGMKRYIDKAIKYDQRLVMDYRHKSVILKEKSKNMDFYMR